ncbi:PROTEIN BPS1 CHLOROPLASTIC-LIKE [Salix purpurea]|uniref:PROTEIN BPS1 CHLOROPLASTIC-LIKE n=1 Tax=Salix purpurea TaxID=77065 RepID=A0A9Q0PQC3_SALPP|nr:PROTEIN BPS1 CHLOROPLASTIC-LIKE [Salix purpurea]
MVLLAERISKLCSKMENRKKQRRQPEALSASLQAFRSDVSNGVHQLCLGLTPGSETLSLSWILQCVQLILIINKAFAKLAVDIDYQMSKWKSQSVEEYLKYSLNLLDLLNSISSSLSHLGEVRLSLAYSLSLVESSPSSAIEHIKAIKFINSSIKNFKGQGNIDDEKEIPCSGEEWIVHQALIELKSVGFWVCHVLLAGLTGDAKPYLKMRKSTGMFSNSSVIKLDMSISEAITDRGVVLKEVKELKDAADCVAAATANENLSFRAEEMQRRLKSLEQLLDGLEKEVNSLFSKVLAGRNELLDGIRHANDSNLDSMYKCV